MPRWLPTFAAIAILLPSTSTALSFTPDPFSIGAVGAPLATVDVVGSPLGLPTGATLLAGTTGAGDRVVLFTVAPTTGFDGVRVRIDDAGGTSLPIGGAGVLAGSGLLPDTTSIGSLGAAFEYPDDAVAPGGGLPTFFVSLPALGPGDRLYVGVASRAPSPLFGRVDFGSTLVPEPGVAALAASALLVLGQLRRHDLL